MLPPTLVTVSVIKPPPAVWVVTCVDDGLIPCVDSCTTVSFVADSRVPLFPGRRIVSLTTPLADASMSNLAEACNDWVDDPVALCSVDNSVVVCAVDDSVVVRNVDDDSLVVCCDDDSALSCIDDSVADCCTIPTSVFSRVDNLLPPPRPSTSANVTRLPDLS